jgi:hypothetical protein
VHDGCVLQVMVIQGFHRPLTEIRDNPAGSRSVLLGPLH